MRALSSAARADNLLNGSPMCSNAELLNKTLRAEFGFRGHVVSDCSAVENIYNFQRDVVDAPTMEAAAAKALRAGCDMCCGEAYKALNESLAQKLVTEQVLDVSLGRILMGRFELGEFDALAGNPFASIPYEAVGAAEHLSLSRHVAAASAVLLKNDPPPARVGAEVGAAGGTRTRFAPGSSPLLPLTPPASRKLRVAAIGPQADDPIVLLGSYRGDPAFGLDSVRTPLQALRAKPGLEVTTAVGAPVTTGDGAWAIGDAILAARDADVAVVFLGSSAKGSYDGEVHLDTTSDSRLEPSSP